MRRQKILVIVCAVLFALLIGAYFAVIRPYIRNNTPEEVETTPETEAGEGIGAYDRIFMFDAISAENIKRITVDNEFGGFAFVSDGEGGLQIDGYEDIPFDEELVAMLRNVTGNTLTKTKVMSGASDEKLEEYGLKNPQASWTIEALNGKSFTVYVGNKLLTGGGYYCMAEGRRSVYVLSNDVASTILTPIEGYVTPVICAGISQSDYYTVDKFTMYKNGERMFRIRLVDKDKQMNANALAENIMDYPTSYYPNSQLYYEIIYQFMGFIADSCYDIEATAEEKAAIGLDDPAYVITLDYQGAHYEIYFSEKQENGTYYVESNMFPGVIGVCSADDVEYLEYDMVKWVDSFVYQQYITSIGNIKIESDKADAEFELYHSADESGELTNLSVKYDGKTLPQDQIDDFRQFYKGLLAITISGYYADDEYCKMNEEEMKAFIADESNAALIFTYTTTYGEESTISFYPYSTRHSLVTVDGVGEFYVSTDLVNKVINDTERILNGETVVPNAKY